MTFQRALLTASYTDMFSVTIYWGLIVWQMQYPEADTLPGENVSRSHATCEQQLLQFRKPLTPQQREKG